MDRRNGGDPLAPPRPPKQIPRVHQQSRPRAPEPPPAPFQSNHTQHSSPLPSANAIPPPLPAAPHRQSPIMSSGLTQTQQQQQQQQQEQRSGNASQFLQSTNQNNLSPNRNSNHNNNNNNNPNLSSGSQQFRTIDNSCGPLIQNQPRSAPTINNQTQVIQTQPLLSSHTLPLPLAPTTAPLVPLQSSASFARRRPPVLPTTSPATLLNNNNSPAVQQQQLQTITSAGQQQPVTAAAFIQTISTQLIGGLFGDSSNSSQSTSVTLAAPRPDSERFANEYVDTPFRPAASPLHAAAPTTAAVGGGAANLNSHHHHHHHHQNNNNNNNHNTNRHHHQHHILSQNNINNSANPLLSSAPGVAHPVAFELLSGGTGTIALHHLQHHHHHHPTTQTTTVTPTTQTATPPKTIFVTPLSNVLPTSPRPMRPNVLPITKQPSATATFTKDVSSSLHDDLLLADTTNGGGGGVGGELLNSITCPQCNRCRCEHCQRPRELPQRWLCNNAFLCSAETVIDYATCLCCVKALFYHCAREPEMELDGGSMSCADDPCSCLPHKRTTRWGCLGALSMALPCLCCYWPMRGCVSLCAMCYARHKRHGCRCSATTAGGGIGGNSGSTTTPAGGQSKFGGGGGGGIRSSGRVAGNGGGAGETNTISGSGMGGGGGGGGNGGSVGSGVSRTIIRPCDLTPEKRLLDSSPEY